MVILEEEGILDHWSHTHPLSLVEAQASGSGDTALCHGCSRSRWRPSWSSSSRIRNGEKMYVCSKRCGIEVAFHKECAEIPRKMKHTLHPQHTLVIKEFSDSYHHHKCAFCKWGFDIEERVRYSCTSSECHRSFHLHLICAQAWGAIDADVDDEQKQRRRIIVRDLHHPKHELLFVSRRAGGSHSFRCDACGANERGDSYLCTVCEDFWIHQKCAELPDSIAMPAYHHHQLSLALFFPLQFFRCGDGCGVCYAEFNPKHWVYHCQTCIYFAVHVRCAFKQVAWYPVTDVVKERITPFVEAIRGKLAPEFSDEIIKYDQLPFHKHRPLSLISLPPIPPPLSFHDEGKPEYICDGCITPILHNKDRCMMRCSEERNYFLHWPCSQLPPQIPSLPLHDHDHHELLLESCSKLEFEAKCKVCNLYTNGLMYACKACDFKADIKCAVLPDSIHHRGHDESHLLNHFSSKEMRDVKHARCDACGRCQFNDDDSDCYVCATCDFTLHVGCALLPETIIDHAWDDHHPLELAYGSAATSTDLYCDCCEEEMNPEQWQYRCESCDLSFHPRCFPDVSGEYRNIKFGQQYTIAAAHPHPLAYQFLTTKRRCDICRRDAYGQRGFQCAPCYFFVCLETCAQPLLQDARIQILDEK